MHAILKLKNTTQLRITPTMAKSSRIRRLKMVIYFVKTSDACVTQETRIIDMVEKHNTLITINRVTYFCIWREGSFKFCNTAWSMLTFDKTFILVNLYSVILVWIIPLIWKVSFCMITVVMYVFLNVNPLKECVYFL